MFAIKREGVAKFLEVARIRRTRNIDFYSLQSEFFQKFSGLEVWIHMKSKYLPVHKNNLTLRFYTLSLQAQFLDIRFSQKFYLEF